MGHGLGRRKSVQVSSEAQHSSIYCTFVDDGVIRCIMTAPYEGFTEAQREALYSMKPARGTSVQWRTH